MTTTRWTLTPADDGSLGLDLNTPLTDATAQAVADAGYRFVVRYVRRLAPAASDLSTPELDAIAKAGLGLVVVQHVRSADSWMPSATQGTIYGRNAADAVTELALPPGTNVFCDLEGVDPSADGADVIAYVNAWAQAVARAGFAPKLYVGWHSGLSPDALYRALQVHGYWAAYNLNADEFPAVRGVQMRQHPYPGPHRVPALGGVSFDEDVTHADALGDRVQLCVPAA